MLFAITPMRKGSYMKRYLFIGAGGFVGAITRFYIKNYPISQYYGAMPMNTLIVNIAGCFMIGFFLTAALEVYEIDTDIRLGFSTGLLGALTTFSTMCKEIYTLILQGEYLTAAVYSTASPLLGISAVYLGVVLARKVFSKPSGMEDYADRSDREVS